MEKKNNVLDEEQAINKICEDILLHIYDEVEQRVTTKMRDSGRSELTGKIPVNLLNKHSRPLEERVMDANRLNAMLLYIEVVLTGELDRYAHLTLSEAKECGAYRLLMKRRLNDLMAGVGHVVKRCTATDCELLMAVVVNKLPAYRKRFVDEGGGTVGYLHSYFRRVGLCELDDRLHDLCQQLCEQSGEQHAKLLADICTVMSIAQTGIEVYDHIRVEVDRLLAGDMRVRRIKSRHSDNVVNLCSQMICLLKRGSEELECTENMREEIRATKREMHGLISGSKLIEVCEAALHAAAMDYTEFALACLLRDHLTGADISEPMQQVADALGGDMEAARSLLEELTESEAARLADVYDLWDMAELLPNGRDGGALRRFRCGEGSE